MIVQHSLYYIAARGIPGLINVVALSTYTRLLSVDEFGIYAAMIAAISFADIALFQWIHSLTGRMLAAEKKELKAFLSGVLGLHVACSILVIILGLALIAILPDTNMRHLAALGIVLLLLHSLFEQTLVIASSSLAPARYGALLGSKSVIAYGFGTALAVTGVGGTAPLLGMLIGNIAALLIFGRSIWRGVYPKWPSGSRLHEYLRYGLPLAIAFSLNWVMSSSDRLLIAFFLGDEAVGAYAAGSDLVLQSSTLLLMMINTAAYPLAVHALENLGPKQASLQIATNGEIIVSLAASTTAATICLAPAFVQVILGYSFREDALRLIPYISASAALSGILAFHYNIAFHLSKRSGWLVANSLVTAILNVALNLILIPAYGILGAAWATFASVGVATLFSAIVGRRIFPMPPDLPILGKAALIGLAVAGTCSAAAEITRYPAANLAFGIATGGCTFLLGAFVFNLGQVRDMLLEILRRRLREL